MSIGIINKAHGVQIAPTNITNTEHHRILASLFLSRTETLEEPTMTKSLTLPGNSSSWPRPSMSSAKSLSLSSTSSGKVSKLPFLPLVPSTLAAYFWIASGFTVT
ncbi:unnamed protein product [Cylicocyclus nassatus]|uniref:Uncharacterized protein n=1 Tax=Cylicocyclus nassatus TaxID=53992 RepID=A0AA36GS06_CYLNA|nr:unnamed protein product [Cylicocyclus nassatus]